MNDDDLAAELLETIYSLLRSSPDTARVADEIANDIAQGRFEQRGVTAPRYQAVAETFEFEFESVGRSKQNVTVAHEYSRVEAARLALKALRRMFIDPGALANYLSSVDDTPISVPQGSDEEAGRKHSEQHPFRKLADSEGRLQLTLIGGDRDPNTDLQEVKRLFSSDQTTQLETIITDIESRLQ